MKCLKNSKKKIPHLNINYSQAEAQVQGLPCGKHISMKN